jgi:hypothetical protein
MKDQKLRQAYMKIGRKLESFLVSQAPVGRTGRLKDQTRVVVDDKGFRIESLDYGFYLHFGTEEESSGLTFESTLYKKYVPNPGKGDGGIKPRYWMSFGQSMWQQVLDELAKEEGAAFARMIQAQLSNMIGPNIKVTTK